MVVCALMSGWKSCTFCAQKSAWYRRVRRRRPIFPCSCPHSIIGAEELNYRVRDGNGCALFATVTSSPAYPGVALNKMYTTRFLLPCQAFLYAFLRCFKKREGVQGLYVLAFPCAFGACRLKLWCVCGQMGTKKRMHKP